MTVLPILEQSLFIGLKAYITKSSLKVDAEVHTLVADIFHLHIEGALNWRRARRS